MIKYLFILINSLTLYIFGLLSGDNGVKVSGNFPTSIVAGKEIAVEVKITKGELSGFGRFQIDVPEGFTIKGSDEYEAEFSFEENKAKWIWASLPAEKEFTLKLMLVASESAAGEKVINAKFSYVDNNEKQAVDMDPAAITVLSSETSNIAQQQPVKKSDSTAAVSPTAASNAEPPGQIVVERFITKSEGAKEYTITVKIKKGATKGFARYSDDAHENLNAKSLKTDGGSFSIADGKIKFVWVNVPDKEVLEVAYALSGNPSHRITINGEYSYLEDNQSKKVILNADTLDFQSGSKETPAKTGEEVAKNEETKPAEKQPEAATTENTVSPEATKGNVQQKNDGNANFLVQIGAFNNSNIVANTLKKKFGITETIKSEMQGGFSKFMIGSHKEYKKAREHSELVKMKNGVKSAFVVAYNDGKRITVQEALMVTNQRWFK